MQHLTATVANLITKSVTSTTHSNVHTSTSATIGISYRNLNGREYKNHITGNISPLNIYSEAIQLVSTNQGSLECGLMDIVACESWIITAELQRIIEHYKPWKWGATTRYHASHTKTMLPQGSLCQDSAGNQTTQRPPDHHKETQTAVVWSCLPFIRSGQNHLTRHSEKGKKRQTGHEVERQHQGMDRSGVRQVSEGSGEQGKMEETGCEIICGAPTTLTVKG